MTRAPSGVKSGMAGASAGKGEAVDGALKRVGVSAAGVPREAVGSAEKTGRGLAARRDRELKE